MGAYTEIVDFIVPSNITTLDFTNLNITKDDVFYYKITLTNNSGTTNKYSLFPNDNITQSNYANTFIGNNGNSFFPTVLSQEMCIIESNNNTTTMGEGYLRILDNDLYTVISQYSQTAFSTTNITHRSNASKVTFPSGINKLTLSSNNTNGISQNTRIQIFKLTAEKLFDFTVNTTTFEVIFSNLNIQKNEKYILVSDIYPKVAGARIHLEPNNITSTDYRMAGWVNQSQNTVSRPQILAFESDTSNICYSFFEISESNQYVLKTEAIGNIISNPTTTSHFQHQNFKVSHFSILNSITSLRIYADFTTRDINGSRFQLYKLY
jgi:hypothetical protein